MAQSAMRTRWAAVGAAVAVTLGAGGIGMVSATSPAGAAAYVLLEVPCRAADTRPGADNVGDRATPIGAGETHTINSNDGDCDGDVPADATGLALNVTALDATAPTFLTIWSGGDLPLASSLNPTPGEPPVPNAVDTAVAGSGDFNIYNASGSVDVVVDVVGYYTDHHHDDRYYRKDETYTSGEIDAALANKLTALERLPAHAQEFDPLTEGTTWAKSAFAQVHAASASVECTATHVDAPVGSTIESVTVRYVAPSPSTGVNGLVLIWKTEATVSSPLADIGVTVISETQNVPQTAGGAIDAITYEAATPYVVQPGDRVLMAVCTMDDLTLWSGTVDLS